MTAEPLPPPSGDEEPEAAEHPMAELLSLLRESDELTPELRAAVARLLGAPAADRVRRLRLVGRARKVSVSMPEDLTTAVQRRVGRGEFSQYVTEAVAWQLERDLVGDLCAVLEAEHGPVSEEALAEARRAWPDAR